ncbi:MAG: hypothetical protein O2960_09370 [Verrucomicrobia bacterium]|nr:hypothetical protein [Verrucomicrobiota bacterium]
MGWPLCRPEERVGRRRGRSGGASLGGNSIASVTIVDNDAPDRPGHGVNDTVLALAAQEDGNVMVGGRFTTINGGGRNSLARVHADLSLDETFDARLDAGTEIQKIAVQPDGSMIIGGSGNTHRDPFRNSVLRLQSNGGLDPNFVASLSRTWVWGGRQIPFTVGSLAGQRNGQILVLHSPENLNAGRESPLLRLNPDGSEDYEFSGKSPFSPFGFFWDSSYRKPLCFLEGTDHSIWVGGTRMLMRLREDGLLIDEDLNGFVGAPLPRIHEYENSFSGPVRTILQGDPEINALALKQDGRVLAGGSFVTCGSPAFFNLAEFYPDGTPYGLLRFVSSRILNDGKIGLTVIATTGNEFTLEKSADLSAWQPLLSMTSATNRFEVIDPDPPGATPRFYRLRREEL